MTLLLANLLIAIVGQGYEQALSEIEAYIYREKTELIVECLKVQSWLGKIKP